MSYQIKLKQFEGPIDLLLFFIRRDKINIYDNEASALKVVTNDSTNRRKKRVEIITKTKQQKKKQQKQQKQKEKQQKKK